MNKSSSGRFKCVGYYTVDHSGKKFWLYICELVTGGRENLLCLGINYICFSVIILLNLKKRKCKT